MNPQEQHVQENTGLQEIRNSLGLVELVAVTLATVTSPNVVP